MANFSRALFFLLIAGFISCDALGEPVKVMDPYQSEELPSSASQQTPSRAPSTLAQASQQNMPNMREEFSQQQNPPQEVSSPSNQIAQAFPSQQPMAEQTAAQTLPQQEGLQVLAQQQAMAQPSLQELAQQTIPQPVITQQTTSQQVTTQQALPQPVQQTVPQQTLVQAPVSVPQKIAIPIPPESQLKKTAQQEMSLKEFNQWLRRSGYAKNQTVDTSTMVTTTTTTKQIKREPTSITGIVQPVRIRRVTHQASRVIYKPLTYEQSQRIMRNSVPNYRPPDQDSTDAFNMLLQQNMPLSPRQVVSLRQQIDVAQRAAATLPNIPPKPVSTTLMINLAPGTTPPAVRLAQGYVTSLVFVDSTGSPWPIAAFDIGNPKAVNIQWDGKSNIIFIQAVSPYSNGDIVIRLVGLPTPLTLELVSGQRVVDYRIDIHVPGIGPNTKELPIGTSLPSSANQLLLGVLDGIAPDGSKFLTVRGADAEAWLLGDRIYLRSRLTVLSPGWTSTMVSPDGMHAYELPKTSSILVSRYGEPAELKVEGL